jgi:hypothetical protein
MTSLPQVAEAIQTVLTDVPEAVARATGYCQRRSKLTARAFVATVVLGWWLHPAATLEQLCQMAATLGLSLSPQGLDQRFGPAAAALLRERLERAVAQVLTADPVTTALLSRFPAVVLLDSTTVALPDALATVWPGCGGRVATNTQAALKITVQLDLVGGGLGGPELNAGRTQDKSTTLQAAPIPAGGVRVQDQGFWSLPALRELAAAGGFFLTRLHQQTAVFAADGARCGLETWLPRHPEPTLDVPVMLGVEERLPVRLLAVRVPPAVADARRRKLHAAAKREGKTPSQRALALAAWTLLVTNLPAERLSVAEALVLARARWQVELLFKRWKSGGRLAAWRSAKPARILCEVYAKLIALVLQHWLLLVGCWAFSDRSLAKAAQTVRDYALGVALALRDVDRLAAVLRRLRRCLAAGCKVGKRRRRPSAFQLLADPSLGQA